MIRNYFKVAWRNLWKNELFSIINILGLGLSIPFALLSLMQVQSAYEYDNFHPYPDRTYRIISDVKDNVGGKIKYALSPQTVAEQLQQDYPAVEKATYVVRDFGWELNNRIKTLNVNTIYIEPAFFDVFGFKLASGTSPVEPNSLVLTEEKALAFFGTTEAVGQVLTHSDYGDLTVTGVLKPYKRNTHLRSDVMVSMATYKKFSKDTVLTSLKGFTYVLLKPNANKANLDVALTTVAAKLNMHAVAGAAKEQLAFRKQAITSIAPDFEDLRGNSYVDSMLDLSVNFGFALALLLLAGFNYVNLTLARSLSRAKEVGVRKVAGALRYQLVGQFICEAVLVAMLSLVLGYIVLKLMEQFSYVNWFTWDVDNHYVLWGTFIIFSIFIGVLAGFIPARILSRFQPAKVLKGTIAPSTFGRMGLRNSLVVIQFVASSCFIFVMATFYNQFRYMATDNDNFNRKHIYNVSVKGDYRLLQQELTANKNIEQIGLVSTPFGGTTAQATVKKNKQEQYAEASYYAADAGFINNMKLQFVAGNNLPASTGDSVSNFVVVNEQLLATLGLGTAQEAVGKTILLNNDREVMINGVVKNFCYYIYQFASNPLVLQYNPEQFHVLSIQTKTEVDDAVFKSEIAAVWKKYHPHEELAFSNYQKEMYDRYFPGRDMKFMGMFCLVVLIIALMGLLGIVTYHTEKRVKEIGIRKVMGASVPVIVKELSKSFVKLIIIAAGIGLPVGYAICYFFISLFAYSPGVNLLLLCTLFCCIFSIALITIAYKSIYAAIANPVKRLRTE
ncbi:putative ABC transport system permease protein [Lacibacter cauensis]|uniref:Putative ABC transport system permease protein n=1 Tax=Lacibacter cauensis TaxID=510947 RepID=A0A562SDJ7_9BACT|nr:ABC transporter permease [Lacibacter cauensis]TWI79349.1 putative ABC transport system permease protein [Lacibacter cauensis]